MTFIVNDTSSLVPEKRTSNVSNFREVTAGTVQLEVKASVLNARRFTTVVVKYAAILFILLNFVL